jgi:hypothetical protein
MIRFRPFFIQSCILIAFLLTSLASTAFGISIDKFQDDCIQSSSSVAGSTRAGHFVSSSAIGGGRSFTTTKGGAGSGVSRLEVVDSTLGYTQGAHAGLGQVSWDGNSDPLNVTPNGLGGLDLYQDGGTSFHIGLQFFDFPFNSPIRLILRVYDAARPDGSKFSEVTVTIDHYFDGPGVFMMEVPFALLSAAGSSTITAPAGASFGTATTLGAGGAADMHNVGAVSLSFNGMTNSKAPDVILSAFKTNGTCSAVPSSARTVFDSCSVCLDDPKANKGFDRCGACYYGPSGSSSITTRIVDDCGVCPGEANYSFSSGAKDICGACFSGPPSYVYKDRTAKCDVSIDGCVRVAPTKQIRGFEKQLLKKADALKQRFIDDSKRFSSKGCLGDVSVPDTLVGNAYEIIAAKGREVFRRGVLVCGEACVTVSFSDEVTRLSPQFKILEREAARMAKRTRQCYRKLGVVNSIVNGRDGISGTIANVRSGLSNLLRECRRSRVCPR